MTRPMLVVRDLVRRYGRTTVLHGVSLMIAEAGAVGVVGESGSGKSTLARAVLGLEMPDEGTVTFRGAPLRSRPPGSIQAVFQDPYGSLDPHMRAADIVAEPLLALRSRMAASARARLAAEMIEAVALPSDAAWRFPHEFSGGQRQRLAIARALVTRPALVVADEPVSALDVSVQAQVLALMRDLRARFGVAWLFISHDLAVVRAVTDTIVVLYRGRVVEQGDTASVIATPRHPYTRALFDAAFGPDLKSPQ